MRWLLVFIVSLIVFNVVGGWLRHIGLGRLPGDFSFHVKGREVFVPIASSLVLAGIAAVVSLLI
jgi:Protein of unknown function (DUF2905)